MILIKGTSQDVLHLAQPWSVLKAFTSTNVAGRRMMSHPRRTCGGEATWRTGVSFFHLCHGIPWSKVGLWPILGMVIKLLGLLYAFMIFYDIRICPFLISKDSHCGLVAGKVGSPSGQPCACAGQHRMSCEVTPHSGPRRAAVYPKDMKEKMCLCKNWSIYVCIVCIYIYIYIYIYMYIYSKWWYIHQSGQVHVNFEWWDDYKSQDFRAHGFWRKTTLMYT